MALLHGLRLERARASKQFHDGYFRNTSGQTATASGIDAAMMGDLLFRGRSRRPRVALPVDRPHEVWTRPVSSGLRVTWLGHSTLLLEIDGVRILTDPVFGERASPVSFAGAKRFHPVPATLDELPPIDAVVLSHDHYDHLCASSVRTLAKMGRPFVTSLGVGARLEALGVAPELVTELDWWERHRVRGLSITATPAQHFSGRSLTDRNRTLWSSWVIESDRRRVFFSGDTGLTDEFRDVRARFGAFDLVMLEIGAWNAAWGTIHLGPQGALRAFDLLGGGTLLPIHWATFDLALHAWDEPAESLLALAAAANARVLTPRLGRPIEPAQVEGPTPWWRTLAGEAPEPSAATLGAR